MAAAAVEKPAIFSRDVSNSSRNSQPRMANLRYFDIIDVSTLQRPVLLLELSTPQRSALHLDVSTLQKHVLYKTYLHYKGPC